MTGPEHYREAERLLAEGPAGWSEAVRISLAAAQVHATLALAAATAAGQAAAYDGDEDGSRSAAGRGKP